MMDDIKNILANSTDGKEIETKVELLQLKIEGSIGNVRHNRKTNRKKASFIKLTTTFCAAAATVLLGLEVTNFVIQLKDIALIFTALVTLLSALEPFFNFRALWVEHEVALWKFYRLRDKLEFYVSGYNPEKMDFDTINGFYIEYQSIWDELSQSWINYRKQESS